MKKFKMVSVMAIIIFSWPAFSQTEIKDSTKVPEKILYICSMHPEIISEQPGQCPKCGMDLVKKNNDGTQKHSMKMHGMMGMKKMGIVMAALMLLVMIVLMR